MSNSVENTLKLALEALETSARNWPSDSIIEAITAIKEALAQPEQEPVAHFGSAYVNENGVHITTVLGPVAIPQDAKLYTTPPKHSAIARTAAEGEDTRRAWVGLTDEEIDELFEYGLAFERPRVIYREIEAKLKEKNERSEKNT